MISFTYIATFLLGALSFNLYDNHVWWSRAIMLVFSVFLGLRPWVLGIKHEIDKKRNS